MKRIVSLLVALALIMSMSATAFAVTGGFQDDPYVIESLEGGFEMTAGANWNDADVFFKYVATKDGTIMTDAASGVWFSVNDAYDFKWGESAGETSVEVVAGDTLYINFANTTASPITANLYYEGDEPAGGNPGGEQIEAIPSGGALALGNNNVELTYAMMPMQAPYWTYTATEAGFLTVTVASINGTDGSMLGMPFGRGMYKLLVGETDGMGTNTATVVMNAGDSVNIAVLNTVDFEPVPAVLNLSFEAGTPVPEKNPADYFEQAPSGDYILNSLLEGVEIFVGNDDIFFTYTAEVDGVLALTASVDGYEATNCAIKVNDGSWAYNAYSAQVAAGDTVRINIWNGFEGVAQIQAGGSIPGGEVPENGIAIESYGNAEWIAPEDGYVQFTINVPGASLAVLNENYSPLGEDVETVTVQVTAGATYGIYPVSVTTASIVTWEYVDAPAGGGDASESIPSGGALALGNNNVELTYAMMAMQAPYWTYTATEAGFLTVTVASINGNSGNMLAMPFGMGRYTLLVGETDGMGTNTATVAMNAGDSVNIAVLDTVDFEAVPAVLNLSFEAGTPAPEKNPADYFEQNPNGQYIIPSLETPVEIFVGNDDIYYVYVAENAGVVTVTPAVDGMTATNCWISYNGGSFDQNAAPVAVEAGGVVLINIWSGYEGTVSFAEGELGGGDEIESAPMSGENVNVAADGSLEIYYTPDADGVLTIDISANPGYRVEVQNAATLDTVGLREESSLAQVLTYNLEAGVEYKITINGFSTATWDVAAATITYDITFEAGETSSDVADLDESDVALVLGEQNVELLPNAITTLYNFAAPEAGVYTVTIPDDAIAELYSAGWISYQICEGNTLVFTATADEQGFLIGLTSELDSMNIKIEKTGTYTPPAQTEYKDYVAKNEIEEDFEQPEEVVSVDITAEQTIVKGEDGYYHLGTADGPILMVNLNTEGFTLATLSNAITMRGEVLTDGDGNPWGYDYMTMISEYYEYSRENDYHPLNDDLMAFFKDYGAAQGWYDQNMSGFDAIKAGDFNEESAWMVALVYVEGTGNQGGNTGNNAQTGDFGVIAAAVALGMSAVCGTAVIAKKKEN